MDAGDLTGKAQDFLGSKEVQDALHSSQAEDISDKLLDSAEDLVDKLTGGKFDDQIHAARDAADGAVGDK